MGPPFAGSAGMRVPGSVDGFEIAVRAILGQQVTVAAGRTFTQRVAANLRRADFKRPWPEVSRCFSYTAGSGASIARA
ncbi:MAG: adenosine deaminase, partial [Brachymonas sp.]|nr:adenosine deaminase [Brachymonas sp.]